MPPDWSPLWLSLRYASLATLLAALLALPLARFVAARRTPASDLLSALATLPIVLPPAVLVYYLLTAAGLLQFAFRWRYAVVLSILYTFPFLLRLAAASLHCVDHHCENAARSLGAPESVVFRRITLPLAARRLFAALLIGFVRAFADFAATVIAAAKAAPAWLLPVAALALAVVYSSTRLARENARAKAPA